MRLSGRQFARYSRHLLMDDIGVDGQDRLLNSHILIVGMGGLGCPAALYLAAAGIGRMTVCDADVVADSNLHRQILYRQGDVGEFKVDCAKRALQEVNADLVVQAYAQSVSAEILDGDYQLVLDCTDNLAARGLLNRHCRASRLPLVSASAIGWEGQLLAFDFVRQQSPCFNCSITQSKPEAATELAEDCSSAGVLGPVLGVMGSLQATTAIAMILGYFQQHGELQRYDGKSGRWMNVALSTNPNCQLCRGSKVDV